jgi:quinoprotein glucose dehydrogenase
MESDFKMRAYDKDTGKVLWEHELQAAPHAEVAVYEAGGREYIVQPALAKPMGSRYQSVPESEQQTQGYYVFALPKTK